MPGQAGAPVGSVAGYAFSAGLPVCSAWKIAADVTGVVGRLKSTPGDRNSVFEPMSGSFGSPRAMQSRPPDWIRLKLAPTTVALVWMLQSGAFATVPVAMRLSDMMLPNAAIDDPVPWMVMPPPRLSSGFNVLSVAEMLNEMVL